MTTAMPIPKSVSRYTVGKGRDAAIRWSAVCRRCSDGVITAPLDYTKNWVHRITGEVSCRPSRLRVCTCVAGRPDRCCDCTVVYGGGPAFTTPTADYSQQR